MVETSWRFGRPKCDAAAVRSHRHGDFGPDRPLFPDCHGHRTLFVWEGIAIQGEEAPGDAPSVAAQLRFATSELNTGLIPVCYQTLCIGRVNWNTHLVERCPVAVAILDGGQSTVEQPVRLAGVQHLSLSLAHESLAG